MRSTIARDRAWRGLRLRAGGMRTASQECDLNASGSSHYCVRHAQIPHSDLLPASIPTPERRGRRRPARPRLPDLEAPRRCPRRAGRPACRRLTGHASGERYHALDPDTYYWAHATFFEAQIATQELFGTPLSAAEKEQLYAESITWYARYGLTMRPVPRDYAAFERYWQSMFEDVLAATPIALAAVRRTRDLPAPYPAIDGLVWAAMRPLIGFGAPWLTRGTLPPRAREILKVTWSRNDELALNGLRSLVRAAWPIVPPRLSRLPRAAAIRLPKRHPQLATAAGPAALRQRRLESREQLGRRQLVPRSLLCDVWGIFTPRGISFFILIAPIVMGIALFLVDHDPDRPPWILPTAHVAKRIVERHGATAIKPFVS
jgi:hypothetical protein